MTTKTKRKRRGQPNESNGEFALRTSVLLPPEYLDFYDAAGQLLFSADLLESEEAIEDVTKLATAPPDGEQKQVRDCIPGVQEYLKQRYGLAAVSHTMAWVFYTRVWETYKAFRKNYESSST